MNFETAALARIVGFVAALWRKIWSSPLAKTTKSLPQELTWRSLDLCRALVSFAIAGSDHGQGGSGLSQCEGQIGIG